MSRVERTENPTDRRDSEQLRQAQRNATPRDEKHPSKAEGEVGDVEEALRHQSE